MTGSLDAKRDEGSGRLRSGLEIERVFLLSGMPRLPVGTAALRIEQGYLPAPSSREDLEGRIRRVEHADGSVEHVHTVKVGSGRVRHETERTIDAATFEREWPRTARQRISKTRHVVREGALAWEIDEFAAPAGLVLAEVELPAVDAAVPIPTWLAPVIVREVTDEPAYTNRAIARRLGGWSESQRA
jgi:adenylate cyclase